MLQSISLRDFVIVSEAQVRFEDGFCVLTGETGAGKSILIDALGLALGSRADSSAVRAGARRADIVAEFRIGPTLAQWLQDNALDAEEDILLLRRVVEADGVAVPS
ncbi:MAG: AAA family ATPase [Burkholderiaceae bacterium]